MSTTDASSNTILGIPAGLFYMAVSAFFFSLMSLLVKAAGSRIPSQEIVFARSFIALILSYIAIRRLKISLWGRNKKLLLFRGLAGFAGLSCFFYALTQLPLADAVVIQYTNPVFTALLAALFLKEHMKTRDLVSGLLCLVGVALISRPTFLFGGGVAGLDPLAVSIALAGAIFSALAYVTVRKLRETEHVMVVVFYFPLISTPASVPTMFPGAVWPEGWEWMLLLGVGITTQIAQVYMTRSFHLERAGRAASISYLQLVFAFLWGIVFFNEYPNLYNISGALLIMLSTLAVARKG